MVILMQEDGPMVGGMAEVGGSRVWYEEAGQGPTVLLLHAGGADSRMWDRQWEPLAEAHRVIRFDLPGAGRSPFPEKPFSPDELLEQLLEALGVERAAVAGVSLGGGLAIDFAIARPERTWGLVVVSGGPRGVTDIAFDPRVTEVWSAAAAGDLDRAVELFIELWAPLRTAPEVDGQIRRMVEDNIGMLGMVRQGLVVLPEWSAADRLGEIRVPALVIWGDADDQGVGQAGERLAAGIPDARRVVLPHVDHFVPMRAPEPFTRQLLAFLEHARPG